MPWRSAPRLRLLALLVPLALSPGVDCNQQPVLFVTSPIQGAFVQPPSVTVTGSLESAGRAGDLVINGVVAPVGAGGEFAAEVPVSASAVLNPIDVSFVATDGSVHLRRRLSVVATDAGVTSEALPIGDFSPQGLVLRLNDSGLDQIEPLIASTVPLDVADLIPVNTLLIDECFVDGGFVGCLAGARVRVQTAPTFQGLSIDFDSQLGAIATALVVTGLSAEFDIDGRGAVPNCDVRITSDATTVTASFDLRRNDADPSTIDAVQVGAATVNATGFREQFTSGICNDGFIGDIIQSLLPDVEGLFEDGLRDFLNETDGEGNTPVAAALEEAFDGLDLTGPIGEAVGVTLDAEIHDIAEDPSGITILQDVALIGDGCAPPPEIPVLAHTYAPVSVAPAYGALTPEGAPYGLGIALSSAALNQLVRSQIECGLLTIEIDELPQPLGTVTGTILGALIPEVTRFPLGTLYEFRLRPTVSPVVTAGPGPGGSLAELLIGGLKVEVRDVADALPPIVDFVVDARLGLDPRFDAGELSFELKPPAVGDITLSVVRSDIGADAAQVEDTLAGVFAFLLPLLGDTIVGVPLPEFLGLQLTGVAVDRVDDHLSLYLDIAPTP